MNVETVNLETKSLRIWPVILLLSIGVFCRYVPNLVENGPANIWMVAAFGPIICGGLIVLWWLLASRASWRERGLGLLGLVVIIGAVMATIHPTMAGPALLLVTFPVGLGVFGLAAVLFFAATPRRRTALILLFTALAFCVAGSMLRAEGMWGNFAAGVDWRWNASPEEEFLAAQAESIVEPVVVDASSISPALANPEWPQFRGPNRDGRQSGIRFDAEWSANPPQEIWRTRLGPGWSSFVVAGDFLFTQEQHGEDESVVCYDANTGKPIWDQGLKERFDDPLGGPGPRATPAIADGDIFAQGGTGWLTRIDGETGEVVWKVDIKKEAGREKPPVWGFSSSPLVVDDIVVVHAGGPDDKGVLAFDIADGKLRWSAPAGKDSYSSAHFATILNQPTILMLSNSGLVAMDPVEGRVMLDYEWKCFDERVSQPKVLNGNQIVIPTGMGDGTRLIEVTSTEGKWTAKEIWTSVRLKPDFNDSVLHKDHLYGFDDKIFTCIDLESGERKWKRGRYGKGQVLLLADSNMLLVTSETGELVLLAATPDKHRELAKFKAIEGKTWNHPVIVGNRLYVRNSREAACFQLPTIENPNSTDEEQVKDEATSTEVDTATSESTL